MKFKELPQWVKDKLLQQHAESCDYKWWDCLEEDFKEDGKERGFDIEAMYFSGFWSQGDGASWVGFVDLRRFLDYHLKPDNPQFALYQVALELIRNDWLDTRTSVHKEGRYSHQYTMQVEAPDLISHDPDDASRIWDGVLQGAVVCELVKTLEDEDLVADMTTWMQDEARDYAGDYYTALEKEYEWMTGEESLIERNLDYDEDGEEVTNGEHVPQTEGEMRC